MSEVEMKRQLAIIKEVRCGASDYNGKPGLTFATYVTESTAASQGLNWTQAGEMIAEYGVADVSDLDGKPCWVKVGGGRIIYDGVAKI